MTDFEYEDDWGTINDFDSSSEGENSGLRRLVAPRSQARNRSPIVLVLVLVLEICHPTIGAAHPGRFSSPGGLCPPNSFIAFGL
jgi:hypothetical protein